MFAGSLLGQRGVVSWSSDQEENSDSEWQVDPALQPLWGKKKKKKIIPPEVQKSQTFFKSIFLHLYRSF